MRAVVQRAYGSPEVLRIEEVPAPSPKGNEIRIRVHASTVTTSGSFMRRGRPYFARMMTGLRKPKFPTPGTDLAGTVESAGPDVGSFRVGDRVFAASDTHFSAHAEYICLPENGAIAPMPGGMDFAEAASLCEGAMTALPFLRDHGKIRSGMNVLVNGASGAIGTAAVQLARHFGAEVTGVCSSENLELVRSLGAAAVIDYTREDFTRGGPIYDIIFDTVGKRSFPECRRALRERGIYMTPVFGMGVLVHSLLSRFGSTRAVFAATGLRSAKEKLEDMRFLRDLAEAGELRSVIDRRYPLDQAAEAAAYVDRGHKKGNVVLDVIPLAE